MLNTLKLTTMNATIKISETFKNEQFEQEYCTKDEKFRYMLLSRMQQDCEYELGNGRIYGGHLWAGNAENQIKDMVSLWQSFADDKKPEWLTLEKIQEYSIAINNKRIEEY